MKIRTISGAILIAVLLPVVISGGKLFAFAIGMIALLAAKEINDIYDHPLVIKLLTYFSVITIAFSNFDSSTIMFGLNYEKLSILILVLSIPIIYYQVKGKYSVEDAFKLLGFVLLIGLGLNYFIMVRDMSLKYFLYMILIPIMTDTFAYISGVMIGKHKVTKLSPKKSWEGYIIGSLMGTFIMTVYYTTFINAQESLLTVIIITFILTIASHTGDLFFSAIKRHYNIKDFANLIPGHGGVLDRIDSLLFVAITFILFLNIL